jgi:hypothetical protein
VARTAVIAGTATAVSGRVARRQEERYAEAEQPAAPQDETAPQSAPSAGLTPEDIDALKELAQLKDQGVLTEEEFAAQKAKILGE